MWKNWNLFKRRTEDNSNVPVNPEVATDGKENTSVMSARIVGGNVGVYNNNQLEFGENDSSRNLSLNNCGFSQVNGYNSGEGNNSCVQASFEQESLRSLSRVRTSDNVHVNGQNGGAYTPLRRMGPVSSLKRPASPFTQSDSSNLPRNVSETGKNDGTNSSFSGVYGPLLSSPLVPKVRRALESSTGLRSPQATLLSRGKPIGRSSSLNYGSGNPIKSTAGKVPWVRLKRKESLTLTDIVNGSTPQSPNTVKLAVPEPRFLPAAPNFKTTPLIVTTEHSRARVVDTQAVVSALREKRKRFGGGQREDSFSEDSWINAAKRRRQDSSQSNASSVSIPSMPESLPDLMGTPGVSLLHIENLKDQRPSTVPAMDAFVSRHQREFGLGGDLLGQSPQLQVYNQAQHQEVSGGLNKQNSKSVLRSVQSSLSSSLRARTNLAMLQNNGPDLTRIRQMPEGYETPRRMSVNFDEPAKDQSSTNAQPKVLIPTTMNTASDKTASSSADKSTPGGSAAKSATPLSIQRQKIADGVVLKKHNLSINSTSTPVKSKQMQPLNMLISTNDIEQDRQKEYKRRVLDLLDEDEPVERPGVSSAPSLLILAAPATASAPAATTSLGLPVGTVTAASSSAATAAAVSASLDSLNKLVQSTAAGSGLSLSSAGSSAAVATSSTNSLSQVLKASGDDTASSEQTQNNAGSTVPNLTFQGNSLATSSAAPALNKEVSFGFIASTQPSQTASTELPTAASSSTGGFQFGASSLSSSSVGSTHSTPAATISGFQINFSAASAPSGIASTAAASVAAAPSAVSMGSGQQSSNGGFNFSLGSATSSQPNAGMFGPALGSTSSQPNAGMFGSALGSQQSANSGFNFGSFPASQTSSSIAGSSASLPVFSGMPQTTALSSASSGNQFNGTLQNPDISFKGPSVQTAAGNTPVSLSTGGILGSGMAQPASSSAPLSLSSTLQAFAAAQSRDESSVTRPTTSEMLNQGFALNATRFSTTNVAPYIPPGMSNFWTPNTATSLSAGFGLASSGVGTAQQGTATVMSSLAPATTGATPSHFGFTFGAGSSATTTAPQQPFGAGPASSLPASSGLTSGGLTGQSSFTGFGLNNQGHSTSTAFSSGGPQPQGLFTSTGASVPAPSQVFGSAGASAFGGSSQASLAGQQAFGTSTGLSMFGTAATTTTTAGTGLFNFGQTSAPTTTTSTNTFAFGGPSSTSAAFSRPFAFGAASTQPAAGFGGVTTTSNSLFGNIVSPAPSAGAASMFGGGTTSAFGTSSVTSPFGSSGQATSAPIFGSSGPAPSAQSFGAMVPTTSPPAFGSMVPTTSPPAFGSMVPTTSPPAFGSAANTSMFGAANSQTQSVFGSAAPSGGQAASVFGASAASSNQLFTFGAGGSSQTPSQQGSTFGSNPSGAFGSAAPAGSSMFGTKPAPPAANPATMFGAPVQSPPSAASSAFGSSLGMSNTFGAQSNADRPAFGAASSAFGTSAVSSFGVTPQNSVFGASSQNSASNLFGVAPQNPPPAFGSQPAAVQTVASSPFGGAGSSGAAAFGSAKPNPFGAATTSQANFNFATNQANQFNAQPANSGYNFNQVNTQPAASNAGYNFNQVNTQPAASNAGFNFGAQTPTRPQLPAPSPGGFNFAATAAGPAPPAFNFNAAPSTPNPFTPQIPGAAPRPRAAARRATRRGGPRR